MPNLEHAAKEVADEMAQRSDRGAVATYIPELAQIDAESVGLTVIDAEGNIAAGGNSEGIHPRHQVGT